MIQTGSWTGIHLIIVDRGSDPVRGQFKWSLKTSKSHFVVKWRNHPNFLISASFWRSMSWPRSCIIKFCESKCFLTLCMFSILSFSQCCLIQVFLILYYEKFNVQKFGTIIIVTHLGLEPCWHNIYRTSSRWTIQISHVETAVNLPILK